MKFSGISDLKGLKIPVFPLTFPVVVTTVLRYRAFKPLTAIIGPTGGPVVMSMKLRKPEKIDA